MKIKEMNEKELYDFETPKVKSIEELTDLIKELIERKHDYGTCVYAMSIAANATFNYVAAQLGASGFQASCADMDFLRRTRDMENGFQIIDYNDVLYHKKFSIDIINAENKEFFRKKCKELLAKHKTASPEVIGNWKEIIKKCGGE